jgi:peptidoglycan/LPS O-acetylase OafA/YrhL
LTRENRFWVHYITFLKAVSIAVIFFWHFDNLLFAYDFNLFGKNGLYELFHSPRGIWWSASRIFLAFGYQIARFFIIASGFGLYLSYLRNRTSWTVFYKKRFFRVIILYWLALFLWYFLGDKQNPVVLFQHFFLVHVFTEYAIVYGPLWFVGYIFQLYLLFPLLVRAFRNKWAKWGLFVSSFFLHQLIVVGCQSAGINITGRPFTVFLSMFLLGMLLAEAFHSRPDVTEKLQGLRYPLASLFTLSLVISLLNSHIEYQFLIEHLVFVLLFFSLIPVCHVCMKVPVVWKAVSALSCGSFVMFLIHNLFIIHTVKWMVVNDMIPMHYNKGGHLVFSSPGFLVVLAFILFLLNGTLAYFIQAAYNRILERFRPIPG